MRIRSVKPEFWRDRVLAGASDGARLLYIGLWGESDDSAMLAWDLGEIAADLYPYRPLEEREKAAQLYVAELLALPGRPRIEVLDCGQHAILTRLLEHQRLGGTRSETVRRKHDSACLRNPPRPSATSPDLLRTGR